MNELSFDPFNADQAHNMWDVVRRLQREKPVAHIGNGFVFVTKYDDVCHVLRNHLLFTNEGNLRLTGVNPPLEDRALGELDPPIHGPIRRLAVNAVTPSSVENMRTFTREYSEKLLADLLAKGGGDLVGKFSVLLTNSVVAKMLGVPVDSSDWMAEKAEEIMFSTLPESNRTERGVGYEGAFPEFTDFIDGVVADRKASGELGDDAVGRLIRSVETGWDDPKKMARMILLQLLLGGTATTRDYIGHLFHHLIQDPKLHAAIDADRSLIPAAVEEGLRLYPPVLNVFRAPSQDTEIRGVKIAKGERVVVGLAAANRDEDIFPDPDTFRLDRKRDVTHMTFGYSSHFCVGSMLAKMEAQIALEVFLNMVKPGTLRMKPGFKMRHMPTAFLYGPVSVDVERVPA